MQRSTACWLQGCVGAPGMTACLTCFPLDLVRTRILSGDCSHVNAFGVLGTIARQEGIGALYVGCLPAVFGMAPAGAVFYGSYDLLKLHHLQGCRQVRSERVKDGASMELAGGVCWVGKFGGGAGRGVYVFTHICVCASASEAGPIGHVHCTSPCIPIPFLPSSWRSALGNQQQGRARGCGAMQKGLPEALPPVYTLLYGGIAGMLSECVVYPLEVVRRRMQMQGMRGPAASRGALQLAACSGMLWNLQSALCCCGHLMIAMRCIVRKCSVLPLPMRMMRVLPSFVHVCGCACACIHRPTGEVARKCKIWDGRVPCSLSVPETFALLGLCSIFDWCHMLQGISAHAWSYGTCMPGITVSIHNSTHCHVQTFPGSQNSCQIKHATALLHHTTRMHITTQTPLIDARLLSPAGHRAAASALTQTLALTRLRAAAASIVQEQGPLGYYAGLAPNLAQVLPSAALSYFFFEACKNALHVRE